MGKIIELFVPGRLCLFGEHSDWAGKHRNVNSKIGKGYAIVTGIEEGIYANVTEADDFKIIDKTRNEIFECKMNLKNLKEIASSGNYWSYTAGVAAAFKEHYNVSGLEITLTKTTIPVKKGLSSSAAICVLISRAFNVVYNLQLNTLGEMNMAYQGEILTPSRCGRLDQACAYGRKPILMEFDGDKIDVKELKIGADFYFVFADMKSKKNTIKILGDLNKAYPFPQTNIDKNVHKYLGEINAENIEDAIKCLENGDAKALGKLMTKTQKQFDKYMIPACVDELKAPLLHKTLEDENIIKLTYGGKGVGSQGDGTIQFLAKDKETQTKLISYLENELKMDAFALTIRKSNLIKKAIIPLAGNGTRMYPMTKVVRKCFLPVIDKNVIKPTILVLLEELYDAGIEKICLIIDKMDQPIFDSFFSDDLDENILKKLSPELIAYERKIKDIGKRISYIYQEEKLGLGHAVSLARGFANNENVLLVLGDQLYKTDSFESCTRQLLNNYEKNNRLMVSVNKVNLKNVNKYGILSGKMISDDSFEVSIVKEKPEVAYAKDNLYTIIDNKKEYFAVFGEYILTPRVFEKLLENIKNEVTENGEYQLTSVLEQVREEEGMIAFIPDGKMLDIGNVSSYKETLLEKMKD